jgi:tRNA A37 threonylcarbamoyladenosine dehydratase
MRDKELNPMEDPAMRFDRARRLMGSVAMERLRRAHVMIVGAGGVGSWAAEAVARTAVGRITVVDFDTVCIRNFNRQLQALSGAIGQPKARLLVERLRLINPEARVDAVVDYLNEQTCPLIMGERPHFVIDAIDHVTSKCFLINYCRENKIPFVVSTGSGGRMDPTQVRVTDLNRTEHDPLARAIRQILRAQYGFPDRTLYGVPAVYSAERALRPDPSLRETDCKMGGLCPQGENDFQSCTKQRVVMGTAAFVTGAFGLACASVAIKHLSSFEQLDFV